jgi:hypothetical protein
MRDFSPSVFPTIDNRVNFFVTGGQDVLNRRLSPSHKDLPRDFKNPKTILESLMASAFRAPGPKDSFSQHLRSFLSKSQKAVSAMKAEFSSSALKAVGIIAFTHDDIYSHIICRNLPREHYPRFKPKNRIRSTSQSVVPDNLGATVFLKFFSLIEALRAQLSKSEFKMAFLAFLQSKKLESTSFKTLIENKYVEFYYRVPESLTLAFRTYYFRERTKELRDKARRQEQIGREQPAMGWVNVPFGEDPLSILARPKDAAVSSKPTPIAFGDDPLSILARQEPQLPKGYKANKRYDVFTYDLFSYTAWVAIFGRARR